MEWKLFDTVPPEPLAAIADRPWMRLEGQPGFTQRAAMVAGLVSLMLAAGDQITSLTDLGCGDGSLLAAIGQQPGVVMWGYEIGAGDVAHARSRGLEVRRADILADKLDYGDLIIASEVLEHLADPEGFLKGLPQAPRRQYAPGQFLLTSSPSLETGDWHNPIHAWAWDTEGYRDLLERSGWRVLYQAECDGGLNTFGGVTGPQRFQAIVAAR
jgi:hypothetical protein